MRTLYSTLHLCILHHNKVSIYRTQRSKRMDQGNEYSLTSGSYRKGKGYDGHPLTLY
jgi:hypothetical protein